MSSRLYKNISGSDITLEVTGCGIIKVPKDWYLQASILFEGINGLEETSYPVDDDEYKDQIIELTD